MTKNDTIELKMQMVKIIDLLTEIKDILKKEDNKKTNKLPREI